MKDPTRYEHILYTIESLNELLKSNAINAETRKHTEDMKKTLEREREEMDCGTKKPREAFTKSGAT